jgi:hypothetical protein
MKKSRKNLTKGLSFSIDMNELNLNRRKFDTTEIGRGIGVQKSKKGKGSYTRKNAKFADSSCGYFFTLSYIKRKTCE